MNVHDTKSLLDIANTLIASLAVLGGAAWVLWRFWISREFVWNLYMTMDLTYWPHNASLVLLRIKVNLKNIGKTRIIVGPSGCKASVYKVADALTPGTTVSWWDSLSVVMPVVKNIDILGIEHKDEVGPCYEIEPGCEYYEYGAVILPRGGTYIIRTVFWWKKDKDFYDCIEYLHIP